MTTGKWPISKMGFMGDVHIGESGEDIALFFVILTVVMVASALFSCMINAISSNYRQDKLTDVDTTAPVYSQQARYEQDMLYWKR